jgi:hypothetical protein
MRKQQGHVLAALLFVVGIVEVFVINIKVDRTWPPQGATKIKLVVDGLEINTTTDTAEDAITEGLAKSSLLLPPLSVDENADSNDSSTSHPLDSVTGGVDQLGTPKTSDANVNRTELSLGVSHEYEILRMAHTVDPNGHAMLPGRWVNDPNRSIHYSTEHLQCLDQERQGNCHDPDAWKNTDDKAKLSRHEALLKNYIKNSPGILNASDPWVWESNLTSYKVLYYQRQNPDEYRRQVLNLWKDRTIFLVGDSLTRQWSQVLRCELIHLLHIPPDEAEAKVQFFVDIKALKSDLARLTKQLKKSATPRDYVVINYGHHLGASKLQDQWREKYAHALKNLESLDYGPIPDRHVLFRTTTVRHFKAGAGDWNTNSSEVGGDAPNHHAQWGWYGGDSPEQPAQNVLALELLAGPERARDFQILDTAPMMLPRGDASFDGSHMCLPGPHQFWSQMLYYRITQEENV